MNNLDTNIKACIFDLDGVIVDTAKYHFIAWRNLANRFGFDFTEKENEKLKGVSRMASLNLIFQWGGINFSEKIKLKLAAEKNEDYLSYIRKMTADEILPGVVDLLEELKAAGICIALGSASKNAVSILEQVDLIDYFESVIDGTKVVNGKPHPEGFLLAAKEVGVAPANCVVFEDAPKGVEAALSAEMFAVGIGKEEDLDAAHLVLPSFENRNFKQIEEQLLSLALR